MNTSNINLELQEILKNYDDVIFDTCAILSSGFIPLLKRNALKVEQMHKHLLLHSAVINELIRISRMPENDKYELSKETLYILKALEMKKIFKYIGNNRNLKLADQQFLEFVINNRSQNKILVITLDNDLINDILMENELESYSGNTISVMKITDDGFLNEVNSMQKNRRALSKEIDVYNIVIDELMTRTPITVSSNLLAVEALKLMNDRNISALPVVDDGKLVGTIRINDITGMGIVL